MKAKADLILHPVRMRIVQTLVGDRRLTVQEMAQRLTDVPQATLYRHLNKLVEGNVIEVVAQNPVRGTVEKVYALAKSNAHASAEEFIQSSPDEQMSVFMQFIGTLMDSFGSYVQQERKDFVKDGASFRQVDLYMNDAEFQEFVQGLVRTFQTVMQNEPREDRKRRTVATIVIPEAKKGEKEG